MDQAAAVDQGFSAKAAEYDALAQAHPVVIWLRRRIRELIERELAPGGSILEINAGSGLDAAYFAAKGHRVHATDIAGGMMAAIAAKAALPETEGRLTYETRSFTDLATVGGGPYDLVFSNLGGLNCIDDLSDVARGLTEALRAGGTVVLVIMPPVCPWELVQVLRGHWRTAWRRLQRGGTVANVEGAQVRVWYHTPSRVKDALGLGFRVVGVRSFCLFAPPSFFQGFAGRFPGLTRALMRLDDRLGGLWPFSQAGDFYAMVARYEPEAPSRQ